MNNNFTQCMSPNYYLTNVVNEFATYDINAINYNTEFHLRNGINNNGLTLNHLEVIDFFVRLLKPKNFLELGVQYGETTNRIIDKIPETYYAVDMAVSDNIKYFIKN